MVTFARHPYYAVVKDLRRTHGSIALDSGLTVRQVADLLGHADVRRTDVYLAAKNAHETASVRRFAGEIVRLATGGAKAVESITNGRAVFTKLKLAPAQAAGFSDGVMKNTTYDIHFFKTENLTPGERNCKRKGATGIWLQGGRIEAKSARAACAAYRKSGQLGSGAAKLRAA